MATTAIPVRPAGDDWLDASTPEKYEAAKDYIQARYGDVAAQDYADWYASRQTAA